MARIQILASDKHEAYSVSLDKCPISEAPFPFGKHHLTPELL